LQLRAPRAWRCLVAPICLVGVASCTGNDGDDRRPPVPPNILVILTDDQRTDALATMPKTKQWFTEEGTEFTRAFATTPQCCPSRASILTGRYSHNHRVRTNYDAAKLDEDLTIVAYLQEAGYRTAIVGKYLNRIGPYNDRANASINPKHFDDWAISLGGYFETLFNVNGELESVDQYSTDFISEKATDLLDEFEEDDQEPWFMYVTPFAPHSPFEPSPEYRGASVHFFEGNPAIERVGRRQPVFLVRREVSLEDARIMRREQLRTLMSVDDLVGSISSKLEELEEDRDTLAIFMSDNGVQSGEKGLVGKGYPYQHSVSVPLIIRWPGHFSAGVSDDRTVANVDITPTLVEASGISVDAEHPFDGRSLLEDGARDELLLEFFGLSEKGIPPWAALTSDSQTYVEYYRGRTGEILFKELYDLEEDPYELQNLAGVKEFETRVEALSRRLASVRACSGSDCP
jgi:arylsulfatase A-like enzyme